MFLTNAWLTYRQSFVLTVAEITAVGAEQVLVSSSKAVTIPTGYGLKFGAITVQTTAEVALVPNVSIAVPCQPLTGELRAGLTNLLKVSGMAKEQSIEQVVAASLEESNRPAPENLPGVDRSALFLTGRLVNPATLQPFQPNQTIVPIRYQRGQFSQMSGLFYQIPTTGSRLGLDQFFGDPLQGWLQEVKP